MKETVRELHDALEKLRRGQHEEIDPIRMLELFEWLTAAHQGYWAAMAAQIATQVVRIRPACQ